MASAQNDDVSPSSIARDWAAVPATKLEGSIFLQAKYSARHRFTLAVLNKYAAGDLKTSDFTRRGKE